jgi:hypothetical protein
MAHFAVGWGWPVAALTPQQLAWRRAQVKCADVGRTGLGGVGARVAALSDLAY